jgi:hypothetical protein
VIEASRLGRQEVRGDDGVLGRNPVPIEGGQGIHGVTGCEPADAAADGLDDAGQLVRRDRRQAVERPRQLVPGDRSGMHAYERVPVPRLRDREVVDREPVDAAVGMESHRAHPLRPRHYRPPEPAGTDPFSRVESSAAAAVDVVL